MHLREKVKAADATGWNRSFVVSCVVPGRRTWSAEEKAAIVIETPGATKDVPASKRRTI
jgi:hypothetical protein